MKKRLLVIDGHAVIYRAFHAFPELSDSTGQPINAVYGFIRILLKSINDFQPELIAVAFDHRLGKSKRVASFANYKAQRKPMPDELLSQIPIIKEVVEAFNIPQFELEGFEADDILGTIAREMKEDNQKLSEEQRTLTTIVTGDKDLLQLVDDGYTTVFIPKRGKFGRDIEYTQGLVFEKLKVTPAQVIELKALMGDPSDNIPGVKGVGEKTAVKLISEFDTLEKIYDKVAEIQASNFSITHPVLKGAMLQKIIKDKEMAFLSRELATILLNAPINFTLSCCFVKEYDKSIAIKLFEKYGFESLKKLLPKSQFEETVQKALF